MNPSDRNGKGAGRPMRWKACKGCEGCGCAYGDAVCLLCDGDGGEWVPTLTLDTSIAAAVRVAQEGADG